MLLTRTLGLATFCANVLDAEALQVQCPRRFRAPLAKDAAAPAGPRDAVVRQSGPDSVDDALEWLKAGKTVGGFKKPRTVKQIARGIVNKAKKYEDFKWHLPYQGKVFPGVPPAASEARRIAYEIEYPTDRVRLTRMQVRLRRSDYKISEHRCEDATETNHVNVKVSDEEECSQAAALVQASVFLNFFRSPRAFVVDEGQCVSSSSVQYICRVGKGSVDWAKVGCQMEANEDKFGEWQWSVDNANVKLGAIELLGGEAKKETLSKRMSSAKTVVEEIGNSMEISREHARFLFGEAAQNAPGMFLQPEDLDNMQPREEELSDDEFDKGVYVDDENGDRVKVGFASRWRGNSGQLEMKTAEKGINITAERQERHQHALRMNMATAYTAACVADNHTGNFVFPGKVGRPGRRSVVVDLWMASFKCDLSGGFDETSHHRLNMQFNTNVPLAALNEGQRRSRFIGQYLSDLRSYEGLQELQEELMNKFEAQIRRQFLTPLSEKARLELNGFFLLAAYWQTSNMRAQREKRSMQKGMDFQKGLPKVSMADLVVKLEQKFKKEYGADLGLSDFLNSIGGFWLDESANNPEGIFETHGGAYPIGKDPDRDGLEVVLEMRGLSENWKRLPGQFLNGEVPVVDFSTDLARGYQRL